MSRVNVVEVILLAAWLGAAIIVAAVVAPAAFKVLPTRTLAGALVGQVLPVIFISGLVVAVVAGLMEVRGTRAAVRWTATAPIALMVVACIVAQFVIGPKIEVVRAGIAGAVDALAVTDPRRIEFGRLHAYSVLAMGIGMIGAGGALFMKFFSKAS
jgi:hypothetical protein